MTFTKRERVIMLFSVLAVFMLVSDRYFLSPVMNSYAQTQQEKEKLKAQLAQANTAIKRMALLQKRWQKMQDNGLTNNFSATESNILRYIKDSAFKNNMMLSSVQPQRIESDNDIKQMEFLVSGTGSMEAVTRFLWNMEISSLPLKVETFQLGSNDENAYQMSMQVKLSSIYLASNNTKKDKN